MKRRVMAVLLTAVLCVSMGMSAFASSSDTSSNSGSGSSSDRSSSTADTSRGVPASTAAPGAQVNTDTVTLSIPAADGTIKAVNLTSYIKSAETTVADMISQSVASGVDAGAAISTIMSVPATPQFTATISVLGANAKILNCKTIKASVATDAAGNTIASAGKVSGVTSGTLVMLMSVNADGTVEFVEGIVDASGQIMGVFKGIPNTITVFAIVQAE